MKALLAAAAAALIAMAAAPGSALADLEIQNDRQFAGESGQVHIAGELANYMGVPAGRAQVSATVYSPSGQEIGTFSSRVPVSVIMPDMRAPFDILVDAPPGQVGRYELDASYDAGSFKDQSIGIASSEMYTDSLENLVITGTVVNNAEATANMVSVVATVYDRQGNVAGVSESHIEPDYLRSEGEARFTMMVHNAADGASGYSVIAESEEYAAVPEFPAGTIAALAASVFGYILMGRKWPALKQPVAA